MNSMNSGLHARHFIHVFHVDMLTNKVIRAICLWYVYMPLSNPLPVICHIRCFRTLGYSTSVLCPGNIALNDPRVQLIFEIESESKVKIR